MAQPKLLKDLLNSPEFLSQREKSQKHVRFEFQDYGYRLASDLGDLQHRPIYMRLAKTTDRFMLEQAAAFAMDYHKERNKGKIFMWKLKQLREENQIKKDKQNLDIDFVLKQMGKLYDELSEVMYAKQKQDLDAYQPAWMAFSKSLLTLQQSLPKKKKLTVVDPACGSGLITKQFVDLDFKIAASDISTKLVAIAKHNIPQIKATRKLTLNKFPAGCHGIWFVNLWHIIPSQAEAAVLKSLADALCEGGFVYLDCLQGIEPSQSWQEFNWREKTYLRFEKISELTSLQKIIDDAGFKIVEMESLRNGRVGLLLQKSV